MKKTTFEIDIYTINNIIIAHIPKEISMSLSSRGMVMINTNIYNMDFTIALEPDGMGGHWFEISESMLNSSDINVGTKLILEAEETINWIEPVVPSDILKSLFDSGAKKNWENITVKARWEWIRWIRFTSNQKTRKKRIITACSMLNEGKKRPCCFDYSRCTIAAVSKKGVLLILQ